MPRFDEDPDFLKHVQAILTGRGTNTHHCGICPHLPWELCNESCNALRQEIGKAAEPASART
jgi:hypothetical protein